MALTLFDTMNNKLDDASELYDIQQNGGKFKIRNGSLLLESWHCDVFLLVRRGDVEEEK